MTDDKKSKGDQYAKDLAGDELDGLMGTGKKKPKPNRWGTGGGWGSHGAGNYGDYGYPYGYDTPPRTSYPSHAAAPRPPSQSVTPSVPRRSIYDDDYLDDPRPYGVRQPVGGYGTHRSPEPIAKALAETEYDTACDVLDGLDLAPTIIAADDVALYEREDWDDLVVSVRHLLLDLVERGGLIIRSEADVKGMTDDLSALFRTRFYYQRPQLSRGGGATSGGYKTIRIEGDEEEEADLSFEFEETVPVVPDHPPVQASTGRGKGGRRVAKHHRDEEGE